MPSIEQLNRLLQADPDDTFLLYGLAQEFAKQGDYAQAVEQYDRVLGIDPDYTYAYYHKAVALEEDGRRAEAVETLRQGVGVARKVGDDKALGELGLLLDELTD